MPETSFFKFLFGFAMIIAFAFGVLMFANSQMQQPTPNVDSVAHPR
jgi:hypothetical protein